MKQLSIFIVLFIAVCRIEAQDIAPNSVGLVKLKSGIKYKITKKMPGTKVKDGDYAIIHVKSSIADSIIYDSRKMGKTIDATIVAPYYKGDINEVLALLKKGESVVAFSPKDSVFRSPIKAPRLNTPYDYVKYEIDVEDLIPQAKVVDWLKKRDDKIITEYLAANNITDFQKTSSGLYYKIIQQGSGRKAQKGNEVSMNYTGKFTNGKSFDSNTDPAFNHVSPFTFNLGTGGVIKGWDEGVALLNEGAKAVFYIPSGLGYGQSTRPTIPPNSVLLFDIEFVKIMPSPEELKQLEEQTIQKYIKDNNLTTQKTASGMHYVITQTGTGPNAIAGKKIKANYTGMLLDGKKFDSNIDSSFNHVTPLTFELGKKNVIAGWDEGFTLLNKGAKAKLIIPSVLAYGKQAQNNIPSNSILVFDVELLDFE